MPVQHNFHRRHAVQVAAPRPVQNVDNTIDAATIPYSSRGRSIVQEDVDHFRIGTIAKLTGLSVERLRAWERRYELVPALRQGKTRYYSQAQLERLKKIKRLIDAGHPISSLVELSDQHLDARLSSRVTPLPGLGTIRTGLIGPNLVALEQRLKQPPRLEIMGRWSNMETFADDGLDAVGEMDVVLAQVPVLSVESVKFIKKKVATAEVVVLYQFATDGQIEQVQSQGIPTLRWPVSWEQIEATCAEVAGQRPQSAEPSPPLFADEELIAIAASDEDPHALPRHLVEMILQLNAFGEFTQDCADQQQLETVGKDRPATAADLCDHVYAEVTHARARLETALQRLVDAERQRVTRH